MKKLLPIILLGIGLLIVIVAIIAVKGVKKNNLSTPVDDASIPEISAEERPLVSLTPTSDGHWLTFKVEKINVKGAASMDYELIYSTQSGGQQGVPGTVKLTGADVERKLLLGSESSGKFRYDVGVSNGTLTIRFRNSSGKLIGKLSTEFTLSSPKAGVYQVTMDSFAEGTKTFTSSK